MAPPYPLPPLVLTLPVPPTAELPVKVSPVRVMVPPLPKMAQPIPPPPPPPPEVLLFEVTV